MNDFTLMRRSNTRVGVRRFHALFVSSHICPYKDPTADFDTIENMIEWK